MDELELLKRDWQKKDVAHPKLTYDEIYKMLWKKSSSIVKWIFVISILEFVLPHLLYLLPSTKNNIDLFGTTGFDNYFIGFSVFYYAVVCYFIYQFYRRYKEISALDNAKHLMSKILKTRRTVKYYIIFSLTMVLIMIAMFMLGIYLNNDFSALITNMSTDVKNINPSEIKRTLIITIGIFGLIMVALMGVVYFLLYGLLLRKLNKNYAELKKLEI
ncbi:hypothetical protein Celal_2858 [Cellulophaga algicola DSM 14237]|uniref:Uncharacterized protein n=2 Tax=Cellulophaga TaxID=104264 RepID=E6XDJ5_CELAD|nr:hypothetical protein Celal_2858 [Cellulophaga algicola DSM 14237]